MLNVSILVVMLNVVKLTVVNLNIVVLGDYAEFHHCKCHSDERR
jgi:hypothetical protein